MVNRVAAMGCVARLGHGVGDCLMFDFDVAKTTTAPVVPSASSAMASALQVAPST